MRPLSAVERFFERLFERPSARLFRARVHPVQILRRVERAMERGRRLEDGRIVVPDRFTVRLDPGDLGRLVPADDLPVELASGALAFARRRAYVLLARPRVALVADATVHSGEVDVEGQFTDRSGGPDISLEQATLGRTRVFQVPVANGPRATILVREPNRAGRAVIAGGGPLTIGRGESNGLVLADPRASRHHARLAARDGHLVLTDLGSTNGTRVNGRAVRELAVGEGDEIRIGDSTLMVAALGDGVPGGGAGDEPLPPPKMAG
jgi:hypothetical protein